MNFKANAGHGRGSDGNLAIIETHWFCLMVFARNSVTVANTIMNTYFLTVSALLSLVLTAVGSSAFAQKKEVSCKLKSEKIIQGREKQCLYVCPDQSLEGRTRKKDQQCPSFISTRLQ